MSSVISKLELIGHTGTAINYRSSLRSFVKFCEETRRPGLRLRSMCEDIMVEYESWLRIKGLSRNSASFYMRNLKAVYNKAVRQNLVNDAHPFRQIFTGMEKTLKRAISSDCIKSINTLNLEAEPRLEFARDMWKFSFYCRGMSMIDIAHLRKDNIEGNMLIYRRHKTGQQLFIGIEQPMRSLIEKYSNSGSPYLFPIINVSSPDSQQSYKAGLKRINRGLREVGRMAGINIRLTSYTSRHTWASTAKAMSVPIEIISDGLGHESTVTTRIYLSSINNATIDAANRRIIDGL